MRSVLAGVAMAALAGAGCTGVGGPKPGAPARHRMHGFQNMNPAFETPGAGDCRELFSPRCRARGGRAPRAGR